jgi:hypothetical protein
MCRCRFGAIAAMASSLGSGGRVVVRPDDYLGAITTLDDSAGIARYFAQIAR